MKRARVTALTVLLVAMMALAACGSLAGPAQEGSSPAAQAGQAATPVPSATLGAPITSMTAAAPTNATAQATAATSGAASGQAAATSVPPATSNQASAAVVSDLQSALQQIYTTSNSSVVNIQVTEGQPISTTRRPRIPTIPGLPATPGTPGTPGTPITPSLPSPSLPGGPIPFPTQAVGSGFVWDTSGRIVTNNHVVDGANRINVTFSDGATVPATVVGTDPDSDLAVIKVDPTGLSLQPIPIGDSTQVHPGQFVVAIGNPFALEGTMTFGIVSAMGRSLPAQAQGQLPGQASYTIPDIIQTDAPINPGNSGGVLLDLQGRLIGVPTAIESASQSNSGVGFAIPSAIVRNIVPAIIQNGKAEHPYLGISGTTLGPELAQAMGLPPTQRGALVIDVSQGGPAAAGGVRGSTQQATINGQQVPVGGDVIVAIDDQPVKRFDDLPSYLARSTKVGQAVKLTVLRDGKQTTLNVTLGNRPSLSAPAQATPGAAQATPQAPLQATPQATLPATSQAPAQATPEATTSATSQAPAQATPAATTAPGLGGMATPLATSPAAPQATAGPTAATTPQAGTAPVWLGVTVIDLTNEMAQAMNLPADQQGVLVESVAPNSPAQSAGLRGSTQSFTTAQGQQILIGGDVIVGVNGTDVTTGQDLTQVIRSAQPGQKVTLAVLRNGTQLNVTATLEARPSQ